jgi:hypothetical protein
MRNSNVSRMEISAPEDDQVQQVVQVRAEVEVQRVQQSLVAKPERLISHEISLLCDVRVPRKR